MPVKVVLKLIYNSILGGIILLVINLIGGIFRFTIAFNIASSFAAGTLGVPGIALLVVLKLLFKA